VVGKRQLGFEQRGFPVSPDPSTKQAQRLWPRWFIAGTKPVKVDLGPAGAGPLVDISGGGCRVQSLAPLRRGAEVPVRIDIPDQAEALQCSGIVVWSKPNGAAGIRFTSLPDAQKTILQSWLSELERAATSPAATQVQDEFTTVVSQIRGAQLNNADALNMIVRRMKELSPVCGAAIALGNPENMTCMASVGEAPAVGSSIPAVIGITGECVFKRKMVRCDDSKNDPRVPRDSAFASAVILPLIVNGEVRGVVEAFSKRSYAFDVACVDALEKFADAIIFVTHGIVTQRRLSTAKASMPGPAAPNLGPRNGAALSPLSASWTAPTTPAAPTSSANVPATANAPIAKAALVAAPKPSAPVVSTPAAIRSMAVATAVEVAPVADPILHEERVQRVPAPRVPPQRKYQPAERNSSKGKWIAIAAAILVVGSVPAWYYVTRYQHPVPAALAAAVSIPAPAAPVVEPAHEPVPAAVTLQTVEPTPKSNPPAVQPKHEERASVVETRQPVKEPEPEPEPIVLAANTPKAPRPMDLDSVVPVKLPTAIPVSGAVSQIALPATSKAAPKFTPPPPEIRIDGTLIKKVNPVYPPMAKSARIQGQVDLRVHVTAEGIVDRVRPVSGQPMLANAAMEAVKQWRYDPARVNGKAVDMETTVRLNFALGE
jgi:periplasmic protein TonB